MLKSEVLKFFNTCVWTDEYILRDEERNGWAENIKRQRKKFRRQETVHLSTFRWGCRIQKDTHARARARTHAHTHTYKDFQ